MEECQTNCTREIASCYVILVVEQWYVGNFSVIIDISNQNGIQDIASFFVESINPLKLMKVGELQGRRQRCLVKQS